MQIFETIGRHKHRLDIYGRLVENAIMLLIWMEVYTYAI